MGYGKIFDQIFDSSIAEDWQVRFVFEDFIVMADSNGVVDKTPESISRRTHVPLDIVLRAIKVLESPDPTSRNADFEGRRLVRLDEHRSWGWLIVSHEIYRNRKDDRDEREKTRERVANWRKRQREKTAAEADPVTEKTLPDVTGRYCNADVTLGNADVTPVTLGNAPLRHTEADTKAEAETKTETGSKAKERPAETAPPDPPPVSKEEVPIPEDLLEGAKEWNRIATERGLSVVKMGTVRGLVEKYERLMKHMRASYPEFTFAEQIRRVRQHPQTCQQSWFQFKSFFFERDYHGKNERFWTGFYDSFERKGEGNERGTGKGSGRGGERAAARETGAGEEPYRSRFPGTVFTPAAAVSGADDDAPGGNSPNANESMHLRE